MALLDLPNANAKSTPMIRLSLISFIITHTINTRTHTHPGAPVLYLDLDVVIVAGLDPLLDFFQTLTDGSLAALGTEGLRSEGGRPGGINSSVLLWRAHDPRWAPLCTDVGPEVVSVVSKFDWWIEMVAAKSTPAAAAIEDGSSDGVVRIQDRWPGLVADYQGLLLEGSADGGHNERMASGKPHAPGEGAAIVVFPLRPKPADLVDRVPWIREHWA